MHLDIVPPAKPAAKVQRLMHVAQKVNEELERLLGGILPVRQGAAVGKVGQDGADVLDGVEDVGALGAGPAVRAGELAVVRRVVADAFGEVQRGGPVRAPADLVSPGGDGREVARRVAVHSRLYLPAADTIALRTEDGADGGQGSWVEVRLCEGSDDFVAFLEE